MTPIQQRKQLQAQGYWITMGVLDCLGLVVMVLFIINIALTAITGTFRNVTGWGKDDSDPKGGFSNMIVRTDALTGCQYLETRNGALAQRVNAQGRQVGCR